MKCNWKLKLANKKKTLMASTNSTYAKTNFSLNNCCWADEILISSIYQIKERNHKMNKSNGMVHKHGNFLGEKKISNYISNIFFACQNRNIFPNRI